MAHRDHGTATLQTTKDPPPKPQPQQPFPGIRLPSHRGVYIRRRKLPTVRLGGNQGGPKRRGPFVTRVLRKMRLRWMKLQYSRVMKRLREYYRGLVRDIIEAGASMESYQQRLLMEGSLAVPVMGVGFNSFPAVSGSDRRPRSIYFM